MGSRFYFNVFNTKGEKVGVHDIPDYLVKTEQECWKIGAGLAGSYYPKTYKVVLVDTGEPKDEETT